MISNQPNGICMISNQPNTILKGILISKVDNDNFLPWFQRGNEQIIINKIFYDLNEGGKFLFSLLRKN